MKALLAFAVICALASPATGEIPSVIYDPRFDKPVWVASDAALDEGRLRPELFTSYDLDGLQDFARRNSEALAAAPDDPNITPCKLYNSQPVSEHFLPDRSVPDLTHHSHAIVTGVVVATRQGFLAGLPGSLLELEATWLKGVPPAETFVFLPLAHIETAEGPLCSTPALGFTPPQAGDRYIAFSYEHPLLFGSSALLVPDARHGVIQEPRKGRPRIPPALLSIVTGGEPTVDAIEDAIRAALDEKHK